MAYRDVCDCVKLLSFTSNTEVLLEITASLLSVGIVVETISTNHQVITNCEIRNLYISMRSLTFILTWFSTMQFTESSMRCSGVPPGYCHEPQLVIFLLLPLQAVTFSKNKLLLTF